MREQLNINMVAVQSQKEEMNDRRTKLEKAKKKQMKEQKKLKESQKESLTTSLTTSKRKNVDIILTHLDDFGTPVNQVGEGEKIFYFPSNSEYFSIFPIDNDFGQSLILTTRSEPDRNQLDSTQFFGVYTGSKENNDSLSFFGEPVSSPQETRQDLSFFGDFGTQQQENDSISFFDKVQDAQPNPQDSVSSFFGVTDTSPQPKENDSISFFDKVQDSPPNPQDSVSSFFGVTDTSPNPNENDVSPFFGGFNDQNLVSNPFDETSNLNSSSNPFFDGVGGSEVDLDNPFDSSMVTQVENNPFDELGNTGSMSPSNNSKGMFDHAPEVTRPVKFFDNPSSMDHDSYNFFNKINSQGNESKSVDNPYFHDTDGDEFDFESKIGNAFPSNNTFTSIDTPKQNNTEKDILKLFQSTIENKQ